MQSLAVPRRLILLALIAMLAAAGRQPAAPTAGSPADGERAIVVIGTRLVDPATGKVVWEAEGADWVTSALGPDGTLYIGVPVRRVARLDIFAVSPSDPEPKRIAYEGWDSIQIGGVTPAGDRLWLYMVGGGLPSGLKSVPLPGGTATADPKPRSYRFEGAGVLLSDGSRWYGRVWPDWQPVEVRFEDGAPRKITSLPGPLGTVTLVSPSGRYIYAVEYGRQPQRITVVDAVEREVERTIDLDRRFQKVPTCAAVLSPGGSRLYMAAFDHNTPLGIDVFDTATFEQVARFFPGRPFYCLSISPDGDRLYASTSAGELLTIDAATGEELNAVPIEGIEGAVYLGLATSTG